MTITQQVESTDDQQDWEQCEANVQSAYRHAQCGRMAPKNIYGMTLCWQHEDLAVKHVISQLERGRIPRLQVENLAEAVITAENFEPKGHYNRAVLTFVQEQIVRYLQDMIKGEKWMPYELDTLIEDLITTRLKEKWSE